MNPKVSVIIATYGAERTIAQTLDSLLAQELADWEALIVDDASPDRSAAIGEEYAARDPRFRVIRRRANGGPGAARNDGINASRGAYLHFLDPDDWLRPEALRVLLETASASAWRAGVGATGYADHEGRALELAWARPAGACIGLDQMLAGYSFAIHAQLIHRDTLGTERFRCDLPCIEDNELFLRVARRGVTWAATPRMVCTYRLKRHNRAGAPFVSRCLAHLQVYRDAFTLAAGAGSTGHGSARATPDLEKHRLQTVLHWTSLMIMDDTSERKDVTAGLVRAACGPGARFSPAEAASSAHSDMPFSRGLDQSEWVRRPEQFTADLGAWWRRCIDEHWMTAASVAEATKHLAVHVAQDMDEPLEGLVAEVVAAGDPSRPVVLLGLGRNGRRTARRLRERNIPFTVRDDGLTPAEIAGVLGATGFAADPASPMDPSALYLMSVLEDGPFLRRLPPGLEIVRFRECVLRHAADVERRLRLAMNHAPASSREVAS